MEQVTEQRLSIGACVRLIFTAFWNSIARDKTELVEIVMGGFTMWFGLGLLLSPASFSARGILTAGNEDAVGMVFVLAALGKLAVLSMDIVLPAWRHGSHLRIAAAFVLLICWSVVTFHFWSLNPWGTGALNYSFWMGVQAFIAVRQVARHGR